MRENQTRHNKTNINKEKALMRHFSIKSKVSGLSFEDIDGGGELHRDKKASKAAMAKSHAALKLFSIGIL